MFTVFIAALLTFIIAFIMLLAAAGRLPLLKACGGAGTFASSDKIIYAKQMAELEKMQRHGLLDAGSAKEARLELARQILAAEKSSPPLAPAAGRKRSFTLFISGAVLFIPLFCGFVYAYQGRPQLPESPFAAFMARNPQTMTPAEKIARLEALSARAPREPAYADELAALYLQAGRFQDAANAYNKAIGLSGESAGRLLGYALALTGFNDGVIDKSAEDAFRNALRLDPQNTEAQLFLARALLQSGKKAEALALLEDFKQKAPSDSAARANLASAIAVLKQGPAPADKAAAPSGLSQEQRQFIAANLGRLEARLAQEPQNTQGWMMLLNAYVLLGERVKAEAALARAAKILPPEQARLVAAAAAQHGLSAKRD